MAPCDGCPLLGRDSMNRPFLENKRGGVLFIGNFPDAASARNPEKLPFNGYKTQLLRAVVGKVRGSLPVDRDTFVMYTYACLCNPEFDKATKRYKISTADFARCSVIAKDFIDIQRPDAIVALGVDVYKVLGLKGTVSNRRGRPASYTDLNGREIPVVCTFDLGTVIKQQGILNLFRDDIRSAFVSKDTDINENRSIVTTDADTIVLELDKINENVTSAPRDDLLRRVVAFDTETTSKKTPRPEDRIIAMSFSNENNVGLAFPYQHREVPFSDDDLAKIRAAVERVLTNPNAVIVTANGKFDLQWLWAKGIATDDHKWDVILAEHVLDEDKSGSYSLKDLTRLRFPRYGNYESELKAILQERWDAKDERVKAIKAEAKANSAGNLANWWVSLPADSDREAKLADWVKRGVVDLSATTGLSSVKTVKRGGTVGPSKKYVASVVKVLKGLPASEFPDGVFSEGDIDPDLLKKTYEDIDADILLHYAAMDAIATRLIMLQQYGEMKKDRRAMDQFRRVRKCQIKPLFEAYLGLSMPLSVELARMELHGIRFDREKAQQYKEIIDSKTSIVRDKIYSAIGYKFNPISVVELGKVLYEDLKLPVLKYTDSGNPSTNEAVLEDLYDMRRDLTVLDDILAYRKLTKTSGTYITNWLEDSEKDGYIHCHFNQTGTATYRLSSSEPNLQNVPFSLNLPDGGMLNLKSLFLPDEGFDIYDLDIKNAEMRVLCGYSNDEKLVGAFNEGKDLHALTASGISGIPYEQICEYKEDKTREEYRQRQVAKKVNFGTIYCMGGATLKRRLWEDCRIDVSEQEAQKYLDGFFETYPGVAAYVQNTKDFVDEHTFVYTFFGRRRRFPYASYLRNDRERIRRQAVNARIQGTSSDMVMSCLIRLAKFLRERNDGSCVLLTVHDSILFQAPHGAHEHIKEDLDRIIVKETAEMCPWLPVAWSYDCGWGRNYGDTHGCIR